MENLIGLSLQFCIKDILQGKVDESKVNMVISGTRITDDRSFDEVFNKYYESSWKDFADEETCKALMERVMKKTYQPRIFGFEPCNISQGHWINAQQTLRESLQNGIDYLDTLPRANFYFLKDLQNDKN